MLKGFIGRRVAQRVPFEAEMTLHFEIDGKEPVEATASNISSGGMQFLLPKGKMQIPPEEQVELIFDLPKLGETVIKGEVCYFSNAFDQNRQPISCYGVKFIDLSLDTWNSINEYCQSKLVDETPTKDQPHGLNEELPREAKPAKQEASFPSPQTQTAQNDQTVTTRPAEKGAAHSSAKAESHPTAGDVRIPFQSLSQDVVDDLIRSLSQGAINPQNVNTDTSSEPADASQKNIPTPSDSNAAISASAEATLRELVNKYNSSDSGAGENKLPPLQSESGETLMDMLLNLRSNLQQKSGNQTASESKLQPVLTSGDPGLVPEPFISAFEAPVQPTPAMTEETKTPPAATEKTAAPTPVPTGVAPMPQPTAPPVSPALVSAETTSTPAAKETAPTPSPSKNYPPMPDFNSPIIKGTSTISMDQDMIDRILNSMHVNNPPAGGKTPENPKPSPPAETGKPQATVPSGPPPVTPPVAPPGAADYSIKTLSVSLHLKNGKTLHGSVESINFGGLVVQLAEAVQPESTVKIYLTCADIRLSDLNGIITCSDPARDNKNAFTTGIFFENLTGPDFEKLRALIFKLRIP